MAPAPARTPQEVFAHHGTALAVGDRDEIVVDYAEIPCCSAPPASLVFRDGMIRAQTVRYTPHPKG